MECLRLLSTSSVVDANQLHKLYSEIVTQCSKMGMEFEALSRLVCFHLNGLLLSFQKIVEFGPSELKLQSQFLCTLMGTHAALNRASLGGHNLSSGCPIILSVCLLPRLGTLSSCHNFNFVYSISMIFCKLRKRPFKWCHHWKMNEFTNFVPIPHGLY